MPKPQDNQMPCTISSTLLFCKAFGLFLVDSRSRPAPSSSDLNTQITAQGYSSKPCKTLHAGYKRMTSSSRCGQGPAHIHSSLVPVASDHNCRPILRSHGVQALAGPFALGGPRAFRHERLAQAHCLRRGAVQLGKMMVRPRWKRIRKVSQMFSVSPQVGPGLGGCWDRDSAHSVHCSCRR